ncbi:MAG: hypothetical protein H6613_18380 [Ignavibacteriales bacterium]|nr:hypothetical protein [Ignavibacteriales bacterium]
MILKNDAFDVLVFNSEIEETGISGTYVGGSDVTSSDVINLPVSGGLGVLNLWLGGTGNITSTGSYLEIIQVYLT